jgi:hypothetical protein
MPSVFIKTYGCQMNERDSEAVAAQLVAKGYTLAPSEAAADVILLNTCSVRDFAEKKAIGKMQNLAADVRKNRPNVVLGFMGCMAQSRGQELIDKLPDVDLVLGTQKFHHAADYLDEILTGQRDKIVDVAAEQGSEATIREHLLYGKVARNGDGRRLPLQVTAYVSIMQGCNQRCTFCIVPDTRGEERSRGIADIVAECRQLVSQGLKEITLLGQIVTSYGKRGFGGMADGRAGSPLHAADGAHGVTRPTLPPEPSFTERVRVMCRHLDLMIEVFGEEPGCRMFRKVAPWYAKRFGPCHEFNKRVVQVSTRAGFHEVLENYTRWRQQFLDANGELQPRFRPPPLVASFMREEPASTQREQIPVPKGPVEVW